MTAKYLWDLIYTSLAHRMWTGRKATDWLSFRYRWKLYHGGIKKNKNKNWNEDSGNLAIKACFKLHT